MGGQQLGTRQATFRHWWDLHHLAPSAAPSPTLLPYSRKPSDLVGMKRVCWGQCQFIWKRASWGCVTHLRRES